jgi:flagellin
VGTGATIDIGPVTTGGTSPSAAANLGWTGDPATVTGVAAVDRVFTISNGRATATITLTSANAATAAAADDEINAQLAAAGITNITAATTANRVDLTGDAGGVANISVGGVSANQVFGVAPPIVAGIEGRPKTIDEIVSAINSNTDLKGRVRASNDNGKLRIENQATGDLSIVGVSGATAKIDGSTGITNTATVGGNDVRKSLVQQFNTLRDQLDKFADDGSFSGVNLLRGDKLTLTFNETGSSTIEIQAKDEASQPISINASTLGIFTLATTAFDSDDTIDGLLVSMSKSLTVIRSQASNFGSNLAIVENRTDFTKAMINTLETGADGLTLADTNEEAANMLALQTRQQLSSTALSLSSQADQAVLRLFG